ncbi:MAG: 16S rRNA (guanine(966)-N(2))-methyltransferase RsmD [Desulfobacterales bacterium]|nr:MAG: 16S rRNA (guanine(966)-N(2))-methyltransferase RsmD [Desulfobacterales bacterium]
MGLRVIGGELKGRKLRSVRGVQTRPTGERVRESIFNILSQRVQGAFGLDLYAGTGALGIEALSRGAEWVLFVDSDKKALTILERNIEACGLERRARMIRWHIAQNLNCLRSIRPPFNLVLMDPPYNQNLIGPTLHHLHTSRSLESGACIVLEHSHFETIPPNLHPFDLLDQRRYGKTLVSFFSYVV